VTEYACALVYQLSGGNPRLINQLCDLALMYGFGEGGDRITAALLWQAAVDRAHGGILPLVVDPRTLLLDPVRLSQESQGRVPKPVPVPVPVPHETPAPVATVHANGSNGDTLPAVVDPRTLRLDPVRLNQEARARESNPVPAPQETPAPVATVHANAPSELYRDGLGLKQKGLYREALKKFEAAEGNPAYCFKAAAQRGFCLRAIGKLDDATELFRHALAVNGAKETEILHVRYILALTLDTMGHRDEAHEQYREIHEADPNFKDIARRIDSDDDSPGFLLSWVKSLRQKWQQFRGTSASSNLLP
jgi:hypothetical protein